jgi:hypothetical protein
MSKTIIISFRCPECGEEWESRGERYKDEYYGWCLEAESEYCPACDTIGTILDDEEDHYGEADYQYDRMVEEKRMEEGPQ